MVNIKVTNHAKRRLKERQGISSRSALKMAEKAYRKGITHSETSGDLHRWINHIFRKSLTQRKYPNNMRLYGGNLYIFCGEILVTVMRVPDTYWNNLKDYLKASKEGSHKESEGKIKDDLKNEPEGEISEQHEQSDIDGAFSP